MYLIQMCLHEMIITLSRLIYDSIRNDVVLGLQLHCHATLSDSFKCATLPWMTTVCVLTLLCGTQPWRNFEWTRSSLSAEKPRLLSEWWYSRWITVFQLFSFLFSNGPMFKQSLSSVNNVPHVQVLPYTTTSMATSPKLASSLLHIPIQILNIILIQWNVCSSNFTYHAFEMLVFEQFVSSTKVKWVE